MLSSCAGRIDSELLFLALWRKKNAALDLVFKLLVYVYLLKRLFDHLCEADLGVTCPEHMQSCYSVCAFWGQVALYSSNLLQLVILNGLSPSLSPSK